MSVSIDSGLLRNNSIASCCVVSPNLIVHIAFVKKNKCKIIYLHYIFNQTWNTYIYYSKIIFLFTFWSHMKMRSFMNRKLSKLLPKAPCFISFFHSFTDWLSISRSCEVVSYKITHKISYLNLSLPFYVNIETKIVAKDSFLSSRENKSSITGEQTAPWVKSLFIL